MGLRSDDKESIAVKGDIAGPSNELFRVSDSRPQVPYLENNAASFGSMRGTLEQMSNGKYTWQYKF